ncbi:MAG: bacillithiol biosynthesis deacetylase BshB1 [Firmicutes bacterium]|nr:bacillithiol biosynthesis deacetylase BshB1 [Bacillota bacterium]
MQLSAYQVNGVWQQPTHAEIIDFLTAYAREAQPVDVAVVAPHPDDAEIAMGATISILVRQGLKVAIVDLTNGEPTPAGTVETRLAEAKAAGEILGIDLRVTMDLPNRYLEDTVENRIKVAEVLRLIRPRILFAPYWVDAHPDHRAAAALVEAARFYAKLSKTTMSGVRHYPARIFHFSSNHYRLHLEPSFVFDCTGGMDAKLAALAAYNTQFNTDERQFSEVRAAIESYGRYWGRLIRRPFGEPFFSREVIGIESIHSIL